MDISDENELEEKEEERVVTRLMAKEEEEEERIPLSTPSLLVN